MGGESFAQYEPYTQYQQHQTNYSNQQPVMVGQNRMAQPSYPQMLHASHRMRQDQAVAQPRQPMMMEAPVYQQAAPQTAAPPLVPSMTAPTCGANNDPGCGCADSYCGNQVGGDYFSGSCGDECCNSCCSDRYLKVFGGWNWLQDLDTNFQTAAQTPGRLSFNDGWAIGGAIGKCMTQNSRRELEFTYRNNTADSISIPAILPVTGVINCYSLMGNLVYDLQGLTVAGFKPYVGGGLGVAYVDGSFALGGITIDDTVFAYQAFAGVDRQLSARAKLFAEYRYFGTSEVEIGGFPPTADEYQANNLFFGLQLNR
jgi:opacity protein-like surface antigen